MVKIKNMALLKYTLIVLLIAHVPKKIIGQRLDNIESMPLTSDGWRPILSNRPQQDFKNYQGELYADSSNLQSYTPSTIRNTSKIVTKPSEISSPASQQVNNTQNQHQSHGGQKQQHNSRLNSNIIAPVNLGKVFGNNQDIILHGNRPSTRNNHPNILTHAYKIHGNSIPSFTHNFGGSNTFRHPVMGKLQAHMASASKRYKHPSHLGSATTRDEVFLNPPSGLLGSYQYFHTPTASKAISSIHHGGTGGKHYIFPGALPSHIDFPNHFSPLPNINDELIQQLMRDSSNPSIPNQFTTFSKQKFQNDFNRNLFPPPVKPLFEADNSKTKNDNSIQNYGQAQQTINDPQVVVGKQKHGEKTKKPIEHDRNNIVPENIVVQLPPPHHSGHPQDTKNVELEITKEKFNVYHEQIPSNYNHHPQVQNFFSSEAKITPSNSKYSAHTYEVTEGKYEESTQPPNFPPKAVSNRYFNQIPPSLQDHDFGFTFLPTPYRPLKVNPTLPTQDVSTVYASYNQNKNKPHDLFSPTQYPIYKDHNQYHHYNHHYNELSTQLSVPAKESQRINYAQNEVTTLSEYEVPPLPTVNPSSYYYTINQESGSSASSPPERATKRPKTTTTTTTTTSTTTETPKTTRSYNRQRNQTRRRRPTSKPTTSYKDLTTNPVHESRVTTPTYESYDSISDVSNKNYQQPSRHKIVKPYRTTQSPEPEVYTTSLQPAVEPTSPIHNRYQISEEQNEEEVDKQTKHRGRPSDFMDEFEDSEYHLRNKYQGFNENKYEKPHKAKPSSRPEKDDNESDDYVESQPIKYSKRPNKQRPTRPPYEDLDEYANFETTKPDYEPPQKNYYQNYDINENAPTQRYTKSTTQAPARDEESVTEKYDIPKITENELVPSFIKETTDNNERIKEVTTKPISNFYLENYEKEIATNPEPEVTTIQKTTTTEAPTTKESKIRTKPNRYETNRPRFSVKDYRNKLNQYSTSTENSIPETTTSRIRFPTRIRTSQTSTESSKQNDEARDHNTPKDAHSDETRKFTPKERRYKSTTENSKVLETTTSTTERSFSAYRSNRTRPNTSKYGYNRYRSTTENTNGATVTIPPPKVVIKPNTLLKRPAPLSLRTRIMNKQKAQNMSATTTENSNTIEFESIKTDSTEYKVPQQTTLPSSGNENKKELTKNNDDNENEEDSEKFDIEDLFSNQSDKPDTEIDYSQKIADLTSSLSTSKDYNTPGMFKTVSPNTSRRVPNYFTIATDDPILPIEAFFPQLSQKDNQERNGNQPGNENENVNQHLSSNSR